MRMFGPYESFLVNFTTVLHQGFLGLINRPRSDELLHQFGKEGNADPALIRMSRVNPKVLVNTPKYVYCKGLCMVGAQFHDGRRRRTQSDYL